MAVAAGVSAVLVAAVVILLGRTLITPTPAPPPSDDPEWVLVSR